MNLNASGPFDVRRTPEAAFPQRHRLDKHAHGPMDRGVPRRAITVVPGSGTGMPAGLAGTLAIRIEGGRHFHDFTATLP